MRSLRPTSGPRATPARPLGCCQRRRLLSTKPGLFVGMREVVEAGVSWTVATRAVARSAGSDGTEPPTGAGRGRRAAADAIAAELVAPALQLVAVDVCHGLDLYRCLGGFARVSNGRGPGRPGIVDDTTERRWMTPAGAVHRPCGRTQWPSLPASQRFRAVGGCRAWARVPTVGPAHLFQRTPIEDAARADCDLNANRELRRRRRGSARHRLAGLHLLSRAVISVALPPSRDEAAGPGARTDVFVVSSTRHPLCDRMTLTDTVSSVVAGQRVRVRLSLARGYAPPTQQLPPIRQQTGIELHPTQVA